MTYFLVDKSTMYRARKNGTEIRFTTERSAKAGRTRMVRAGTLDPKFEVMSADEFHAADPDVTVKNLMTGKDVVIKQSQRGGCCDPSMERYWSM